MDIDLDEGEIVVSIRATRIEFAELYHELSKWNASNPDYNVMNLLGVIAKAAGRD